MSQSDANIFVTIDISLRLIKNDKLNKIILWNNEAV